MRTLHDNHAWWWKTNEIAIVHNEFTREKKNTHTQIQWEFMRITLCIYVFAFVCEVELLTEAIFVLYRSYAQWQNISFVLSASLTAKNIMCFMRKCSDIHWLFAGHMDSFLCFTSECNFQRIHKYRMKVENSERAWAKKIIYNHHRRCMVQTHVHNVHLHIGVTDTQVFSKIIHKYTYNNNGPIARAIS